MKGLIVISGLPGTGKSTIATGLAERLRVPVLSVDPIESSILKSGIGRSFETGLAAYLVAETLAAEQLKCGISVIIDAVSPVEEARDMWRELSREHGARLVIIECVLDAQLHQKRILNRVRKLHAIPEVTWEYVEARRKEYLAWNEERLVLDTSADTETCLQKALAYCQAQSA